MPARRTTSRIIGFAIVVTAAVFVFWLATKPNALADRQEVYRHFFRGNFESAAQLSAGYLKRYPDDHDVRLMAAKSEARLGNPAAAIKQLQLIQSTDNRTHTEALLLEADLTQHQLFDLDNSEQVLLRAVANAPADIRAREQLVRLYAACGRRHEALPHLLKLVQLNSSSDLLMIAARASGGISDPELLDNAAQRFPQSPNALLGLAMLAERKSDIAQAIRHCESALQAAPEFAAVRVNLGQYLLEAEDFDKLELWNRQLTAPCLEFAQAWRVRGYLAERQGHRQQALEFFLKAASLGPDLKDVHHRISQLLFIAKDTSAAEQFSQRVTQLQQLQALQDRLFSAERDDPQDFIPLVRQFRTMGRIWESLGWTQLGLQRHPRDPQLNRLQQEIAVAAAGLPLELVPEQYRLATKVASDRYSIPDTGPQNVSAIIADGQPRSFAFRNDAAQASLKFVYINGVDGPTHHRMFEFSGGGIGVCDFDRDDFPDLFLSQGSLWEQRNTSAAPHDVFVRNIRGLRFAEVTDRAGISESAFGQGVAVGDINSDGFPDVFVSNIGDNALWQNNGDGTFSDVSHRLSRPNRKEDWHTSALIADLDRDGGADIYVAAYLQADDVFDRICRSNQGKPQACSPALFNGTRNLLYLNNLNDEFRNESERLPQETPGKSLGLIAWSSANDGRLSVFVSNDTTPNQLYRFFDSETSIHDQGFASGLAVNATGKSEGCMGIAAGDVDGDGFAEILVTNFYNETNTFYHSTDGQVYQDRTSEFNLNQASLTMLGFGTQFLDADLDGDLELFVANGHVDDLRFKQRPYQMPAQFFYLRDGVFTESKSQDIGEYFAADHLGRSVVSLDWNVDGQTDLAVGHLTEDYALLTNVCPDSGQYVCLNLSGTRSSRDSVGASVTCMVGEISMTRQLTAGDGYHATNQRQIVFGCGSHQQIDTATIVWPSGQMQTFHNLPTGARYAIVEGVDQTFRLP